MNLAVILASVFGHVCVVFHACEAFACVTCVHALLGRQPTAFASRKVLRTNSLAIAGIQQAASVAQLVTLGVAAAAAEDDATATTAPS